MSEIQFGRFTSTLAMLARKGVRFSTTIDLGCADGHFFLSHYDFGVLQGSIGVNIDANALYEPSLKAIRDVLGGHYMIAAVSDVDGETELQTGSHPYWASLLPPDHSYWAGSHNRPGGRITVQAITLDTLVTRFGLKPPYLLKLDLQGGELAAFRGGEKMLAETDLIICESSGEEFPAIGSFLASRNFDLFDVTEMAWLQDGSFCQFYPVFINRRLNHLKTVNPWDVSMNERVIAAQDQRRRAILDENAKILNKYRKR